MTSASAFAAALGIAHPIVQGPMNGASPPELAAAVSNAGGLGSFAAALLPPSGIAAGVARVRALTDRPFNVNLFILDAPPPTDAQLAAADALLAPIRAELGLAAAVRPTKFCEDFGAQLAALLELAPPVVSFTFGVLDAEWVARFRRAGCTVIGTATTVAEALAWEAAGADSVVAQGAEAGGHRATFLGDIEQSSVGLMALLPQVVAAVKIPVIAAGGIMNGRGIAASLLLGAQAAQLGTAFLSTPESGIAEVWRSALLNARDDSTRLTRALSGRHARGIVNEFMQRLRPGEDQLPGYPVQNALTAEIRQTAARLGRPEFMSLWAGQGVGLSRALPAAQLLATLAAELQAVLSPLT